MEEVLMNMLKSLGNILILTLVVFFTEGCAIEPAQVDNSSLNKASEGLHSSPTDNEGFPHLLASPGLFLSGKKDGKHLEVELRAQGPEEISSILVELYDASGNWGGDGMLSYDHGVTWKGLVAIYREAAVGTFYPDVTLNVGDFLSDTKVIQTIYFYRPADSELFYNVTNNLYNIDADEISMNLSPARLSAIPLVSVDLYAE
ncbi:MAG: hypothetical protein IID61_16930 [SAR324 cluster bacterium]|nr:hypothetical protein [SAR324 cluster bacterium]